MKKRVNLYLDESERNKLKNISKATGLSVNSIVKLSFLDEAERQPVLSMWENRQNVEDRIEQEKRRILMRGK